MDIYKHKFTSLQCEIFSLLCFRAGEKLNQLAIANLLKVSPTAVGKALPGLVKEQMVKLEKGNINFVQLNRDDRRVVMLKRVENLRFIYESGLPVFLEESFPGCAVVLFGSYSRGEDSVKSDIDIAVVGTKGRSVDLSGYEKKLGKTIRINFYASFNDIHIDLKSSIVSGITLAGVIRL